VEKRFFHLWECIELIMAIQSRLNSRFQRRSNARPRKADRLILRRAMRDVRDHSAQEMAGKKAVTRELHDFHERSSARIAVRRELRGSCFMVSCVSVRFSAMGIGLPFAVEDDSSSVLERIK